MGKNNQQLRYEDPLNEGDLGKEPKPAIMSVYIPKIVRDDREPLMKYDPSHPDANSEGYVAYPNVNPVVDFRDTTSHRAAAANLHRGTVARHGWLSAWVSRVPAAAESYSCIP